ncbi:MAG: YbaB/EbfC family nucleoid-associated protein [Propionibacteriaceae bacterium]|jgi:DNA-binding protein YbaB|nr:YbaB/EbfC family nucleoid-associated protein [Propionibacteriaceae bacterium]
MLRGSEDEILAQIQEQVKEAEAQAQRAKALSEDIDKMSVSKQSQDGSVELSVDSLGRITELELSPSAARIPMSELAKLILKTATEARMDAGTRVIDMMGSEFGEDSMWMDQMRNTYLPPAPPPPDSPSSGDSRLDPFWKR